MYPDEGSLFEQFDRYEDPDSSEDYAEERLISRWEGDVDDLESED